MDYEELSDRVLGAWRRHQKILLYLLEQVPDEGLAAVPSGSRGRDVARQFAHLDRVRRGWIHFHRTGERPKLPRVHQGPPPPKAKLTKWLEESGAEVERFLDSALGEGARPRKFGRDPIRFMAYLIAHESHHRGQILLALKQNGLRLPEQVAVQGVWGQWIFGK